MRPAALLGLLSALAGCGYSTRVVGPHGDDLTVFVPLVEAPGIDVDAPGFVDASVRREVARAAGLSLAGEAGAQAVFRVEVLEVRTGLAPFAEPALRAAQYQATIRLRGRLERPGAKGWRSGVVTGAASYLSTAGPIERLDGAGRRALARAAEDAAEQLVAALVFELRRPPVMLSPSTGRASPATDTSSSGRSLRPAPPR